jgi:hypothetical protein
LPDHAARKTPRRRHADLIARPRLVPFVVELFDDVSRPALSDQIAPARLARAIRRSFR